MQNEQLDAYIEILRQRLNKREAHQREDELREVRQHLESLVSWHMQQGKSKQEAVELALTQFGKAESIGQELNRTLMWQKFKRVGRSHRRQLTLFTLQFALVFLFFHSMSDKPTDFPYFLKDQILLSLLLAAPAWLSDAFIGKSIHRFRAGKA